MPESRWATLREALLHKKDKARKRRTGLGRWLDWAASDAPAQRMGLLFLLSSVLTILIFPWVLERSREYQVGDVVGRGIRASQTYLVEDTVLTEQRRREASENVLSLYDMDDRTARAYRERITQAFDLGRHGQADQDPASLKSEFEAVLGLEVSDREWGLLKKNGFSLELEAGLFSLLGTVIRAGVVPSRDKLLEEQHKGFILRHLPDGREEVVRDVYRVYDLQSASRQIRSEARSMEMGRLEEHWTYQSFLAQTAIRLLKPNLTFNREETELRVQRARKAVRPVFYEVRRGEMLVREGEQITPQILSRLKREAEAKQDKLSWMRLLGMFLLLMLLFHYLRLPALVRRSGRKFTGKDTIFLAVNILTTVIIIRVGLPVLSELARSFPYLNANGLIAALPVAAAAILAAAFVGQEAAILSGLAVAFLAGYLTEEKLEFFIFFLTSSLVAAHALTGTHKRSLFIRTGLMAGGVNMAMIVAVRLIKGNLLEMISPVEMLAGLIGGLLAGVIATGLSPLFETAFGYSTSARLLEQANLDHPTLKELLFSAPGTYHHSIIVGNMVEVAAEAIGANPLLSKVAAYYHDIGKVKKPLYFVENQFGENKHEKLAPSMSALILIAHVKDGVEIGRQARLGRQIEDIIAQHHGTSLISYFYDKAVKLKGDKEQVNIEDFRYPGPKPQTKEAGLVMLADQVEAACKALADPTPAKIQGLVQKVVNRAFSDGQLSDCELTLKDLNAIAKSFNQVLAGIHHHRVQYPELGLIKNGSVKRKADASPSPQRAESRADKPGGDRDEDSDNLRRLGMS